MPLEGDAEATATGAVTRSSAEPALSRPPDATLPERPGGRSTVPLITPATCWALKSGRTAMINAATPATLGDEKEVPEPKPHELGRLPPSTFCPGAARSTLVAPKLENAARA